MWDAVEEAIRWWIVDYTNPTDDVPDAVHALLPWNDPDPLPSTVERLLAVVAPVGLTDDHDLADLLSGALRVWMDRTAIVYNDGRRISHGAPRHGGWRLMSLRDYLVTLL